jgi:hypothetical protein
MKPTDARTRIFLVGLIDLFDFDPKKTIGGWVS